MKGQGKLHCVKMIIEQEQFDNKLLAIDLIESSFEDLKHLIEQLESLRHFAECGYTIITAEQVIEVLSVLMRSPKDDN